ncbi:MAG: cupin domain-containing protein [Rhodothermales bacterium]|nr:cupin domain-containing protein [Rhodothermales bacterium]MCA0267732.1 cupin domain-containing protein [Bacteroidota bacterium]
MYTFFANLADEVELPASDRIVSRKLAAGPGAKAVLFGFAAGQELTEHTSAKPAILHLLEGTARITLGDDAFEAEAGAWALMPPHLPHSIAAQTPVRMLLVMLEG